MGSCIFMEIKYKELKSIRDKDLRPLYDSVGWVSYTEKIADMSTLLTDCQLVYSAWHDELLVGLIRTVGDGISIQYVQDILVLPKYHRSGIGTKLLKYVMERSINIRQLVLITDGSKENETAITFYKKLGLLTFEESGLCGLWRVSM